MKLIALSATVLWLCCVARAVPQQGSSRGSKDGYKAINQRDPSFYGHTKKDSPPPHHLDVALPQHLLTADNSLLIHLKDHGLWDKENLVSNTDSKAALLPSYLKTLLLNDQDVEDAEFPQVELKNMETDAKMHPIVTREILKNIQQDNQMHMVDRMQEILDDEQLNEKVEHSEKEPFSFELKDAIKSFYASQNNEDNNKRLRNQTPLGVFFNLADLESQLKESFDNIDQLEDVHEQKIKQLENHNGGVFKSIVEMLKDYANNNNEEQSDVSIDEKKQQSVHTESDDNNMMLQEMTRSNVSVKSVDSDGGIYFSLAQG